MQWPLRINRAGAARANTEVRDPSAATVNLTYYRPHAPMPLEWEAETAIRYGHDASVWVYRCAEAIAQALSRLPFRAGADPDRPEQFDTAAPLARLLGPPPGGANPVTTARSLWAWTVVQRLITGRWGWEVELPTGSRTPIGLWPLPASQLRPIASTGGARYFESFEFGPADRFKTLRPDQVVYGWNPSPSDYRQPQSVLQAARLDVSVQVMQDRVDYAMLLNGGVPAHIITHAPIDDDDKREQFRRQFRGDYRGPDNAGKSAFAEYAGDGRAADYLDVKTIGHTARDNQEIERYEAKVRSICVAFGTAMSILGDSSERTFSNAAQERVNWYETVVFPLAHELADVVNIQLAPRLGNLTGWFDTSYVDALRAAATATTAPGVDLAEPAPEEDDVARATTGRHVRAAPEIPPGATMVALYPSPDVARAVAVPDGLEPSELHVTLAYLGEGLLDHQRAAALTVVAGIARQHGGFGGTVGGLGQFPTADEDDPVPFYAPVDVPRLADMRARLVEQLRAARVPVSDDHGFTPHMTLTYGEPAPDPVPSTEVAFFDLYLVEGGRRTAFQFTGERVHPAPAETREADQVDHEARRARIWRDTDRQVRAMESRFQGAMSRLFRRQADATLSRLEGKRGRQAVRQGEPTDPEAIYTRAHWAQETAEVSEDLYAAVFVLGAERAAATLGISFDLADAFADEFIRARANQLAGHVVETTYQAIKLALETGVAAGEGIPELAARIRAVFAEADRVRSVRIARTEVISAYNGSALLVAQQLPGDVAAGKEWIATRDARVRESHAAADGQIQPVSVPFEVGPAALMYPGAPSGAPEETINCRCTLAFLDPAEMPEQVGRHVLSLSEARAALAAAHRALRTVA